MLDSQQISELVVSHGATVNVGRSIRQLILDGELPRLKEATILEGKVSDSVFGPQLTNRDGQPLRLMFRNNRISTHDMNRGTIPFKDQVLAVNHHHMLNLVAPVLGSSQFSVPNLAPVTCVIAAENLELFQLENVLRLYNAESSTSTSLYQHWSEARDKGLEVMHYAGHEISVSDLTVNGRLPYLMDTPSTKDCEDRTMDPKSLIMAGVCTEAQYTQIRNSSLMAFGLVSSYLATREMVLVDTKTEHGINSQGQIVAADELYTMDSSRFWKLGEDGQLLMHNGRPVSFSKEFARGMVTNKRQQFSAEQANEIAVRYIQGLQHLTGEAFSPDLRSRDERIVDSTQLVLDYLL
ncbi:MAG: phosphoribosylaminoimidazolesuccinocarboxamide synthase [Gammaproteobacteria bacterium]|nr:phosphoribosylaminoimidazolesuccinocarboxamide synthase [Gammaproteobacteria bacterium]